MHTPANWTVVSTGPARIPRIESEGTPVALMFQESAHYAALIAAAPDLLAAVARALQWCEEHGDTRHKWYADARAAIARAEGEA